MSHIRTYVAPRALPFHSVACGVAAHGGLDCFLRLDSPSSRDNSAPGRHFGGMTIQN